VASSALGTGFVRSAADCTSALTLAVCRLVQLAARARSVLDSLSFRRRGIYDKTKLIFGGFEITRRRFPPSGCFTHEPDFRTPRRKHQIASACVLRHASPVLAAGVLLLSLGFLYFAARVWNQRIHYERVGGLRPRQAFLALLS
jgi:hypothetical protein